MASAAAKSMTSGAESNKTDKPKITPNMEANSDFSQQTKDQRRRYLDKVHLASTEFSKNGAPGDMFKLVRSVILPDPLLWSEFAKKFVFGRPQELGKKLTGWRCKHIVVRYVVYSCKKIAPITNCV